MVTANAEKEFSVWRNGGPACLTGICHLIHRKSLERLTASTVQERIYSVRCGGYERENQ